MSTFLVLESCQLYRSTFQNPSLQVQQPNTTRNLVLIATNTNIAATRQLHKVGEAASGRAHTDRGRRGQ